ncbi:MAG: hypothetical protein FJ145_21150 [Deltaproteobacteria bacterium]|nr:hypothetical protein [Deltaproteobacteria bacterium]
MASIQVLSEPIEFHCDHRGLVFEPLLAGQFDAQRNLHVVLTAPGHVRGNHYHRQGTEVLAVVGSWLIRYRENNAIRELTLGEKQAMRMTIPPGIAHAFKYIGTGSGLLVAFTDLDRDAALADVEKDVLIAP